MNKTISINIGGRIFNIAEEAYQKLEKYLNTLKVYFSGREGGDEIIADIEARIAELFDERITTSKQVITPGDVDEIISIMGRPEDYMDDLDDDSTQESAAGGGNTSRRIYRDPDDKVVFGVCSGISAYLGWDPVILRAAFVIALLVYGTGPLVYIILALIIPKAKTTAEKLRMRGEPVTVESISKKVRESFKSVNDDVNEFGKRHEGSKKDLQNFGKRLVKLLADLFEGLVDLLRVLGRALGKIIGIVFIIAASFGLAVLVASVFGFDSIFVIRENGAAVDDQLVHWLGAVTTDPRELRMLFIGLVAVVLVPLIGILLTGISLFTKYNGLSGLTAIVLLVVFFVGVGLIVAVGISTSRDFATRASLTDRITPLEACADTLVIDVLDLGHLDRTWKVKFDDARFYYSGRTTGWDDDTTDARMYGENQLTIEDGPRGSEFQLRMERSSRGGSQKQALENAEMIEGRYRFTGDSLKIFPYYSLRTDAKWRSPRLEYVLSVPLNGVVYFTPASKSFIYDIPNVTNTYDRDMVGHHWLMTNSGLECTDCSGDHDRRAGNRD